jgi:RNA polymerase sigma-70 factor (ECF subfamily)
MTTNGEPVPSFEHLANELRRPLFGYLCRMVGNSADADDLLQETLIRIAGGLPKLGKSIAVKSWAFRIATNIAIDHIRKNKRAGLVELNEDYDHDDKSEDRLVLDEMNSCIRGVIDSIPPDDRAAIVLFNLEGKTISETAEILGISFAQQKSGLSKVNQK